MCRAAKRFRGRCYHGKGLICEIQVRQVLPWGGFDL